jgi:hypothetical protein
LPFVRRGQVDLPGAVLEPASVQRIGGVGPDYFVWIGTANSAEALWKATDHGAIQTVATDEICCPLRIKLQPQWIDGTTGGNAGV